MEDYVIRRVCQGDERTLAHIQTESWKAAFKEILSDEDLIRCTNIDKATAMYKGLLEQNKGNGYILEVSGKPHAIAYWDKTRETDMEGFAELICIHSLQDNWGKGYGSRLMDRVLDDVYVAGYRKIMLWVFDENVRARKFYEAKGFKKSATQKEMRGAVEVMYVKEF